jgi:hypothetical protein
MKLGLGCERSFVNLRPKMLPRQNLVSGVRIRASLLTFDSFKYHEAIRVFFNWRVCGISYFYSLNFYCVCEACFSGIVGISRYICRYLPRCQCDGGLIVVIMVGFLWLQFLLGFWNLHFGNCLHKWIQMYINMLRYI